VKVEHDRRLRALDEFIAGYEAEHGEITEDEMAGAVRRARERAVVVRGDPGGAHGRGAVVCLARDGDDILTSDPDDLRDLAQAASIHVKLIPV
jgi:hypothetical protein